MLLAQHKHHAYGPCTSHLTPYYCYCTFCYCTYYCDCSYCCNGSVTRAAQSFLPASPQPERKPCARTVELNHLPEQLLPLAIIPAPCC
jgi:hypothetical protein